jgi:hypothetical protein
MKQRRTRMLSGSKLYESSSAYRDHAQLAAITGALLDDGKPAEAEPLARECLALREKTIPEDWLTCDARIVLGASLLGQQKYAEAEPLLLSGYEGLKESCFSMNQPIGRRKLPRGERSWPGRPSPKRKTTATSQNHSRFGKARQSVRRLLP